MYRGWLTVDYDEPNGNTFRGLNVEISEQSTGNVVKNIRFDTGDPVIDWYNYYKFIYGGEAFEQNIQHISGSSNTDHWFMDSEGYCEKILIEDGDSYRFATDDEMLKMSISDIQKSPKVVTINELDTFEKVKTYYKSKVS